MTEIITDPDKLQTPQQAAHFIMGRLPQYQNAGLNVVIPLKNGEKIHLNALDIAVLHGTLAGIATGRVSCGDAKVHGCLVGIVNTLRTAAQKYVTPAAPQNAEMPVDPEVKIKNDESLAQINELAKSYTSALFTSVKFGLTADKIPLLEMTAERGIGFSQTTEPGPTGKFVDRVR